MVMTPAESRLARLQRVTALTEIAKAERSTLVALASSDDVLVAKAATTALEAELAATNVCVDPLCAKSYSGSYVVCPGDHIDTNYLAPVAYVHDHDRVVEVESFAKAFRSGLAAGFGRFNDPKTTRTSPRFSDPRVHSHTFQPSVEAPARCIQCGMGSGAHQRMVLRDESLIAKAGAAVRSISNRFAKSLAIPQTVEPLPDDSEIFATSVTKADPAKRFTLGPVYMPDTIDAHRDFASGDELQKAAWEFVRSQPRTIYLQHSDKPAGEWVEMMQWPMPVEAELMVPTADGDVVRKTATLPADTIYMGVVWEPWAWTDVNKGKLLGYSMGGRARRTVAILGSDDAIAKHANHDQSSHGKWANGGDADRAAELIASGVPADGFDAEFQRLGSRGNLASQRSQRKVDGLSGAVDPTHVPDTTAIRRSRVSNIDTDRLKRRRDRLVLDEVTRGGRGQESRQNWSARIQELDAVETELEKRNEITWADRAVKPLDRNPLLPKPTHIPNRDARPVADAVDDRLAELTIEAKETGGKLAPLATAQTRLREARVKLGLVHKHASHDQSTHGNWAKGNFWGKGDYLGEEPDVVSDFTKIPLADADQMLTGPDAGVHTVSGRRLPDTPRHPAKVMSRPSLKIKREDMPQVPKKVKGEFVNELRMEGVFVERRDVRPDSLFATQSEMNSAQVAALKPRYRAGLMNDAENPIIVSADNYILDGHHRWAAARSVAQDNDSFKIPVLQVDMPIRDLLDHAADFNKRHDVKARSVTDKVHVKTKEDLSTLVSVTKALVLAFVEAEYDDERIVKHASHDQSTHGNWAGGSGGANGSGGSGDLGPRAMNIAYSLADTAEKVEKTMSPMLDGIAHSHGGHLEGFDFRFKDREGIVDKVQRKARDKRIDPEEAAATINDALRYTVQLPVKGHAPRVRQVLSDLADQGWKAIEVENNWPVGDAYNGVNTVLENPDGFHVELQFHTPGSYRTVQVVHKDYELYRKRGPAAPEPQRREAFVKMQTLQDANPRPVGIEGLGTQVFRPYEPVPVTSTVSTPRGTFPVNPDQLLTREHDG